MFEMLTCNVAVLAIAGLYYSWRERMLKEQHRRRVLRERVAFMLWTAAQRF
jgi:hypothetical protein